MDFGSPEQAGTSLLNAGVGDTANLTSLSPQDLSVTLDWDTSCLAVDDEPSGAQIGPYTAQMLEYPDVGESLGPYSGLATAIGNFDTSPSQPASARNPKRPSTTTAQHSSSRAARNGREQQRAQKISDMIDKLKGTLDRAKFTNGDPTSKLNVLMNCESYVRSLLHRTRCCEMETELRGVARGNHERLDSTNTSNLNTEGGCSSDWLKSVPVQPDGGPSGDPDSFENRDESGLNEGTKDGAGTSLGNGLGCGSEMQPVGSYPVVPPQPRSASESGATSSLEDGDAGSTDDTGGDASVATADSSSQGFSTDSSSRGFTTDSGCGDSSFAGDSGSAYSGDAASGDAGSADGSSEGSYEGAVGQRMRVVNYFDIFRLSNVPMAIASKDGALVDVNDAMRGFGRIDQETVKTLTVQSLVAAESSQALEEAMTRMLAPTGPQEDVPAGKSPQEATQPFLANAGIGDRPSLLTVSLVYDERGDASAFHVALIPRSQGPTTANAGHGTEGGTVYGADGQDMRLGSSGQPGEANESWEALERRSVRFWEAEGDLRPAKRRLTDAAAQGAT